MHHPLTPMQVYVMQAPPTPTHGQTPGGGPPINPGTPPFSTATPFEELNFEAPLTTALNAVINNNGNGDNSPNNNSNNIIISNGLVMGGGGMTPNSPPSHPHTPLHITPLPMHQDPLHTALHGTMSGDIYIGRLNSRSVTTADLSTLFSQYGHIIYIRLYNRLAIGIDGVPIDSHAFVRFADGTGRAAERAIREQDKQTWMGQTIKVEKARLPGVAWMNDTAGGGQHPRTSRRGNLDEQWRGERAQQRHRRPRQ